MLRHDRITVMYDTIEAVFKDLHTYTIYIHHTSLLNFSHQMVLGRINMFSGRSYHIN